MSWLGQWVELSFASDNVLADHQALEQLGFQSLPSHDVWTYPHSTLSDGVCHIGLHAQLASPCTLSFVNHDLLDVVSECRARGIELIELELGPERFNMLHFTDPNGIGIQVFGARGFSASVRPKPSQLGELQQVLLSQYDYEESTTFWERLGVRIDPDSQHFHLNTLSLKWRSARPKQPLVQLQFANGLWPDT